ncbi:PD-(D/E)XK nuclease family protein [Altererythrobacter sp. BO-6]|uniref:PD-(D/E)XK nuclease family protein n=1 Tax=Altererythrobacter sp. BO-6 TaxID=2604537 RepID=UPI0032167883
MPGPEFRIGLAAHDLASALGAPEVVLTRAIRDMDGPTIPSRFLLRVQALLGENAKDHEEREAPQLAAQLDRQAEQGEAYPRPEPCPDASLRDVPIKVTGLDRLLGDPYQFYAQEILRLRKLDPLAADPDKDFAWKGTQVHAILQRWHEAQLQGEDPDIRAVAEAFLREANIHPLMWGLWRPRILEGLAWVAEEIAQRPDRRLIAVERKGEMTFDGVKVYGRADRIDRMPDGTLAIVDYKTNDPPSAKKVEKGFALQMGTMGLIARDGKFGDISGETTKYEYWSLAKADGDFGYIATPWKDGGKRTGIDPEDFLPEHERFLQKAIGKFIKGTDPFTAKLNPAYPGYTDYDQLMRLDEWQIQLADTDGEGEA